MELTLEKAQEMMSNFQKNNVDRGINDTKIRLKVGELTQEEAQELMSNDNGNLNISGARITKLPDELEVKGNLNISFTKIKELPNGLKVNGNLNISFTKIKELPNGLKVNGDLDISNTMITELPNGLEVKGNLDIHETKINEFSIEKLPEELFVGGAITANPSTRPQTFEEWQKWYEKKDKWENEIRQKQQLPHSEEKQKQVVKSEQAQPEKPKPVELLVKTVPFEKDGTNIKGFATLTINNSFCVKSIKILDGKNGLFVSMPSYKNADGEYENIAFGKTKEAKDEINARILKEFENPTEKTIDKNLKPMENDIEISMQLTLGEKAIKGIATITINETFVIKRACVVEGKNGLFVQMPSYKKADGEYENIVFPIEKTVREQLNKAILDKYNEVFEKENVKTMEEWEKDIDTLNAEKEAAATEKAMEIQSEKSAENNER
ncbi:MAG: septation protein SpoVG family protein [Oscillospiraceae bacterium]